MYFSAASLAEAGRNEGVGLGLFAAAANFAVDLVLLVEEDFGLEDAISLVIEVGFSYLVDFVVGFHFDDNKLYPSKLDDGAGFEVAAGASGIFEVVFPVDFIEIMEAARLFFFNLGLELKYSSILSFIN